MNLIKALSTIFTNSYILKLISLQTYFNWITTPQSLNLHLFSLGSWENTFVAISNFPNHKNQEELEEISRQLSIFYCQNFHHLKCIVSKGKRSTKSYVRLWKKCNIEVNQMLGIIQTTICKSDYFHPFTSGKYQR